MSDLIDRQAVKELAHNQIREKYCGVAFKKERDFYIRLADSIINLLPSAQPERKKGKWSIKEGELAIWDVCSECKKMVMHKAPFYNFCPNCGAKMEVTE